MARPGVIGMAMRDNGALHCAHRVDMEAARLAAQAGGDGHQDVLRAHAGLYRRPCVEFYPSCAGLTRASILEPMPSRLFLSSGDLMADRRFDFARDLQLKGDLAAAADLLMQAIELAPNFASAWFTLGGIREELGEHPAAIAAYQKAQASDPGDRHGAGLRLMRLGAEPVSGMPQAYVQTLFDQYAPRFEASLVGDLGYRGPALLFKAVLSVRSAAQAGVFQARHRPRLRHRAGRGSVCKRGRSFHRRRSVAAHDRAVPRHRPLRRA